MENGPRNHLSFFVCGELLVVELVEDSLLGFGFDWPSVVDELSDFSFPEDSDFPPDSLVSDDLESPAMFLLSDDLKSVSYHPAPLRRKAARDISFFN